MLFKNALKTFKKKFVQLSAVGFIIFLSSFLFTTMFYAISSLQEPSEEFFKTNNQENFSVDMVNFLIPIEASTLNGEELASKRLSYIKAFDENLYNKIIESREKAFEDIYKDYDLELRQYKDITFELNDNSNKIRIIKDSKNINIPLIEEGVKPQKNNEIAITRIYAKKNNLNIGDDITIKNNNYKVVGFVLFPDYNLPMTSNDFLIDNSTQCFGLLTDDEYDELNELEGVHFSGVSKANEFNEKDFESKIIDDFKNQESLSFITNITSTKNQMRSGAVYEEIRGGKAMSLVLSTTIASIAIIIVGIIMYKLLRREKGQIGVLKSLGYSDFNIGMPYIGIIILIALPMLIIGYFIGKFAAVFMRNLYLEFYLLPAYPIKPNSMVFLLAIVLPLIVLVSLSMIIIFKMLKKEPVELLKVGDKEKVGFLNRLVNKILKNAKSTTKFKYSFIFSSLGKSMIFFFGIMFTSILIIFSLSMTDIFDKMIGNYYKNVDYKYEAYIDFSKSNENLNNNYEKFLEYPYGKYNDDVVSIKGLEDNNKLHKLYNPKKEDITNKLNEGVIVNKSFSKKYNVNDNDALKVEIEDKLYDLKVVGISDDYNGYKIYMDINALSNIISDGKNKELFNGVYSKEPLNENNYLNVINKQDILSQSEKMEGFTKYSIYMMLLSSMVIAIIILYILTSLTIEDKYYDISLLKVMGYENKEINSMILNSYLFYLLLAYVITVPISIALMNAISKYLIVNFNMIMPLEINFRGILVGFLIVLLIFIIGTLNGKRKINKISLQQILKEYRD